MISLFSLIFLVASPRTFNNFPFIGYTPYMFLSFGLNPDKIPAFAESPSHKINVHNLESLVPA